MQEIAQKLREKYQADNRLKRSHDNGKGEPLSQSYINVAIVEEFKEEKLWALPGEAKPKLSQFRDERLQTYEAIYKVQKPIAINEIFDYRDRTVKKIILYGRAGIGKSTLARYLAVLWQEKKLWTDKFDAVILLHLRDLIGHNDRGILGDDNLETPERIKKLIADVIQVHCMDPTDPNCCSVQAILNVLNGRGGANPKKILAILDGYDEVQQLLEAQPGSGNASQSVVLKSVLQAFLKSHDYHVILTSRPAVISSICGQNINFDIQLENIGFTNENIRAYVRKFRPYDAEEVLRFLESNKGIWGIAHVPINLDLICTIWKPVVLSTAVDPHTTTTSNTLSTTSSTTTTELAPTTSMTSATIQQSDIYTLSRLYGEITDELMVNYLKKKETHTASLSPQEVRKQTKHIWRGLEILALEAMKNNHIIISSEQAQERISKVEAETAKTNLLNEIVHYSGLLRMEEIKELRSASFSFLHLTFQEYCAASAIAKGFNALAGPEYDAAVQLLQEHKYTTYYEVVWWFTAGILYQQSKIKQEYLPLLKFWDAFEQHPRELIGIRHLYLTIRLLDECQADVSIPGIQGIIRHIEKGIDSYHNLNFEKDICEILYVSPNMRSIREIYKKRYIKVITDFLARRSKKDIYGMLQTVQLLSKVAEEKNLITKTTLLALEDEAQTTRNTAVQILGALEPYDEQTIESIKQLIYKSNSGVKETAITALGQISRNNHSVRPFLKYLSQKGETLEIKLLAAEALGTDCDLSFLNTLTQALQNSEPYIRAMAIKVVAKLVARQDMQKYFRYVQLDSAPYVQLVLVEQLNHLGLYDQGVANNLCHWLANKEPISGEKIAAFVALNEVAKVHKEFEATFSSVLQRLGIKEEKGYENSCLIQYLCRALPLHPQDGIVTLHAIRRLEAIAKGNELAIQSLMKILQEVAQTRNPSSIQTDVTCRFVVETLSKIALGNQKVIVQLSRFLDRDDILGMHASYALSNLVDISSPQSITHFVKTVQPYRDKFANYLDLIKRIYCYAISNDSNWLHRSSPGTLEELDILLYQNTNHSNAIILAQSKRVVIEGRLTKIVLQQIKKEVSQESPNQQVHDYYLGTGTLGLKIPQVTVKRLTPLHKAAEAGELEKVREILAKGEIDIDDQNNEYKYTPLILAVTKNQWPVVDLLVERKADFSCMTQGCFTVERDTNDKTALEIALSQAPTALQAQSLLKNYYISHSRFQSVLKGAIFSYSGLHSDETVVNTVMAIIGKPIQYWREDKDLIKQYELYLKNLVYQKEENVSELTKPTGGSANAILSIRLHNYIELYFRVCKGLEPNMPKKGDGTTRGVHDTIEKLFNEIYIIANTIIQDKFNWFCAKGPLRLAIKNNQKCEWAAVDSQLPAIIQTLSETSAAGIMEQLGKMQVGQEYHLSSGYNKPPSDGHSIYIGLHKLTATTVLARVDNRWLDPSTNTSLYSQGEWLKQEGDLTKIRSYCVGVFKLDEEAGLLQTYISGTIYAICNSQVSPEEALKLIYGQRLLNSSTLPASIQHVPDLVKEWPDHNKQKDANNCTISSHNLGVAVRWGQAGFEYLLRHELSALPKLEALASGNIPAPLTSTSQTSNITLLNSSPNSSSQSSNVGRQDQDQNHDQAVIVATPNNTLRNIVVNVGTGVLLAVAAAALAFMLTRQRHS